jgi:signal transduction histidine kinase
MRLLPKLTLGILAAAAVPLAIAGFSQATLSERALRARIGADRAALAGYVADGVARSFDQAAADLELLPQLRELDRVDPALANGVMRVAYHASDDAAIVAFLRDDGQEQAPAVYVATDEGAQKLGKPKVSDADHDAFLARVPVAQALAQGRALGAAVMAGDPPEPRIAVAVAFAGAERRYVLAADLSLVRLGRRLALAQTEGAEILIVDRERRAIARGLAGAASFATVAVPSDRDPSGPLPRQSIVATVTRPGEPAELAAWAPVPDWGLGVVVRQAEAAAFAPAADIRRRTFYWLGVAALAAAIVGLALARDVGRRLAALATRTQSLARGDFEARLDATGDDELAGLARSFNKMAADLGSAADELGRRAREIEAKNAEINAWNRELAARVEERTRELRRAEAALLRARSLSAVGSLGAGMAHEINNPLTGILGAAQLLLADTAKDAPIHPLLVDLEKQAQRIRAIVHRLLELAERERGQARERVDLGQVVRAAADKARPELDRAGVTVKLELDANVPSVPGDPRRLEQAVSELLENARRAMPKGGTVTVATHQPDRELVNLRVSDTGIGIAPEHLEKVFEPFFTTKTHWRATGMGLTLIHKTVEEHQGVIHVDSEPGKGTSVVISLPAADARGHLA